MLKPSAKSYHEKDHFSLLKFLGKISKQIVQPWAWWLGSLARQCTIQCIHILAIGGSNPAWGRVLSYGTVAVNNC